MIPLWVITGVGAAAIAGAAGFWTAWELQAGAHAKYLVTQANNTRATERMRRQNSNTAAVAHEADKIVIKKVFVPITQEVEKIVTQTVYLDTVCLPADGLSVLQSAISRANGDTGEPGDHVPTSTADR